MVPGLTLFVGNDAEQGDVSSSVPERLTWPTLVTDIQTHWGVGVSASWQGLCYFILASGRTAVESVCFLVTLEHQLLKSLARRRPKDGNRK